MVFNFVYFQITGAARGLGREICIQLAKEGCTITCIDIILAGAKETAKLCNEIKSNCAEAHLCDITDRRKVAELVKLVKPVDVLINNAGIVSSADIMEVSDENIERMMNVNVMAQFWVRNLLKLLKFNNKSFAFIYLQIMLNLNFLENEAL